MSDFVHSPAAADVQRMLVNGLLAAELPAVLVPANPGTATATPKPTRLLIERVDPRMPAAVQLPLPEAPVSKSDLPGRAVARFADGRRAVSVSGDAVCFAFDPWTCLEALLTERWRGVARPFLGHLPVHPHRVPARLRLLVHGLLQGAAQGSADFPSWPIEPAVDVLIWMLAGAPQSGWIASAWPGGASAALVIMHDLDTSRSYRCIDRMSAVERDLGLRACYNIVGLGYAHDHRRLANLRDQGHEIGLHGVVHDNRLPWRSEAEIRRLLDRCRPLMRRHGIRGFRAPSLLTSPVLDRVLADYVDWSSNTIDTDVPIAGAPPRGVSTVRPFRKSGVLEIPQTLPLDDRLLLLGYRGLDTQAIVRTKLDHICAVGGVVVVGNHPEPHLSGRGRLLSAYGELLEELRADVRLWPCTPSDLVHHVAS